MTEATITVQKILSSESMIKLYRQAMKRVHGPAMERAVELEYKKGFFKLSIPIFVNGIAKRMPTRSLRKSTIAASIRRLTLRYWRDNRLMIPSFACVARPIDNPAHATHGEVAVLASAEGLQLVWKPNHASSFLSDPIVSCYTSETYSDLLGLINYMNEQLQTLGPKVITLSLRVAPVGADIPMFVFVFLPPDWREFASYIHDERKKQ